MHIIIIIIYEDFEYLKSADDFSYLDYFPSFFSSSSFSSSFFFFFFFF